MIWHRNIAHANIETWLVETQGHSANAARVAMVGGVTLAPRPQSGEKHIVGTIVFSHAERYKDRADFRANEGEHRIVAGAPKYDWDGKGELYAWRISAVRRLTEPIPTTSSVTGWSVPRDHEITFAAEHGVASGASAQSTRITGK